MIRRLLPHPATSLLLLVTWLLLVDSLSFGQWLLGGALAGNGMAPMGDMVSKYDVEAIHAYLIDTQRKGYEAQRKKK